MKNEIYAPHASSIGNVNANVMALICYLASIPLSWIPIVRYAAWLAPLVLFLLEKQSGFVRFHAMQSFLLNVISAVLGILVSVVLAGILGFNALSVSGYYAGYYAAAWAAGIIGLLTTVISLVILVFSVIAMIGAYRYKETHIPILGDLAEKIAMKKTSEVK